MKAARMLHEVVEKHLRETLPDTAGISRIVVRVYADLTGLSKNLAKSKLVGLEKRSLAAFAAGFTRAMSLFDFVDALDEEGTKFKIRGKFSGHCLQMIVDRKLTHAKKCSNLLPRIAIAVIFCMLHVMIPPIYLKWSRTAV